MEDLKVLQDVIDADRTIRQVEPAIFSILDEPDRSHHYDNRALLYDTIVGTQLYNAILWGSSPDEYTHFAHRALMSCDHGLFLDAGCGSLLFTAAPHSDNTRRIIAFDQSISMLRRARQRLINLTGAVPDHIILLQADLRDLPFHPETFSTILCLNVLHQFPDAASLAKRLENLLTAEGSLFLTSLVLSRRFVGDLYLQALYRSGEFVRPRSLAELKDTLGGSLTRTLHAETSGNMAFIDTASERDGA